MDQDFKKWFVRIGSLLLVAGFFLPLVTVSCVGTGGNISLAEIAQHLDQPILYMMLLASAVVLVVSLLPSDSLEKKKTYFWVELGALAVSLGILTISLLSMQNKTHGIIKISPNIGALAIAVGYGLAFWGALADKPGILKPGMYGKQVNKEKIFADPPGRNQSSSPHCQLNLINGQGPGVVQVDSDKFFIGRGSGNDLILQDLSLSRSHAVLRWAQGCWFIQDQDSTGGVFVNGARVKAVRLANGDQIKLGNCTFSFRS